MTHFPPSFFSRSHCSSLFRSSFSSIFFVPLLLTHISPQLSFPSYLSRHAHCLSISLRPPSLYHHPIHVDRGYSFDQVLFRGHLWALFQLDLLVFAAVDLVAQNYVLAAIITYIVTWVRSEGRMEERGGMREWKIKFVNSRLSSVTP